MAVFDSEGPFDFIPFHLFLADSDSQTMKVSPARLIPWGQNGVPEMNTMSSFSAPFSVNFKKRGEKYFYTIPFYC